MAKVTQCQSCGMPIDKKRLQEQKVMVQPQKNIVILLSKWFIYFEPWI